MKRQIKNYKLQIQGFTLIELLLSLAILIIVGIIAGNAFFNFRAQAALNRSTQEVVSTLRQAASKTVSAEGPSSWGVHFASTSAILFKGTSYSQATTTQVFKLEGGLEIANLSLNSATSDVVFLRPKGDTNNYGTLNVRRIDQTKSRLIRIERSGLISVDTSAVSSPLNPFGDTRHIHLTLGWSIQNSNTMSLIFHNPPSADDTENIPIQNYLNSSKTQFTWSGTFNISGSNQTLNIISHSLDAANTLLSINRDARENNKALDIKIDDKLIISYDASGSATVGPYGGTMEIQ